MVPIALSSIVRLSVCNAIDRVVCRAAPSKTRRSSVEVGSHPSLAGAELCPDISHQTSSHSPRENVGHGQRDPVAKPKPTVDCPVDDRCNNCQILLVKPLPPSLPPEPVVVAQARG